MSDARPSSRITNAPAKDYIVLRRAKEEIFRIMLRRIPCLTILFINFTILTFMLMAILCITILGMHYRLRIALFNVEEDIIKSKDTFQTFDHCHYNQTPWSYSRNVSASFHMDYCTRGCGPMAYAYRVHEVNTSSLFVAGPHSPIAATVCHPKHEMVNCSSLDTPNVVQGCLHRNITECPGFNGSHFGSEQSSGDYSRHLAKLVSNEDLETLYKGKLMHVNNLILRCPVCVARTAWFRFKDINDACFKPLITLTLGSTYRYALCSEFLVSKTVQCTTTLEITPPYRYTEAASKGLS
ncbi:unnamed protein product [Bursaphelenchus xylophilus]|uniref:(pine wood nematode) hypothetical protein n=1 Tax=Bursaphelenchus xylophilus TaxID=6326 RepID=A0A1I7SBZ0_BURXY|nr:unnamed protein product [Bursaphelenchus xylophilus]CAG9089025.1 unnamed protein product [Bursaphelenchus xylophilus]